ncbi:phosphatase PAP2 family protein [Pseudovibrio exalbescens]|uniref:phosphatase PAP2 family protein n=1 Tax=Pseudovibrio exalbescens TaxID=197461 RepID=UPI0011AFB82C|nr:phosphatase PAP2 family protein [Pseudovibrio exalbescens]
MKRTFIDITGLLFKSPVCLSLVYIIGISAFFLIYPTVDIWASHQFYNESGVFPATQSVFWNEIRYLNKYIIAWITILSVAVLLLKLLLPRLKAIVDLRAPIFLLSTLIIGPGIVVNMILKDNIGRPRPRNIEEFGGSFPFIGVWETSPHCGANCSFVSGEASVALWITALAFLLPKAWRLPVAGLTLTAGLVFSINRVAFGGHFLSDTLLSWGITFLVIWLMYSLLYRHTPRWAQPDVLDNAFTSAGLWLQQRVWDVSTLGTRQLRSFSQKFR